MELWLCCKSLRFFFRFSVKTFSPVLILYWTLRFFYTWLVLWMRIWSTGDCQVSSLTSNQSAKKSRRNFLYNTWDFFFVVQVKVLAAIGCFKLKGNYTVVKPWKNPTTNKQTNKQTPSYKPQPPALVLLPSIISYTGRRLHFCMVFLLSSQPPLLLLLLHIQSG